MPFDANAWNRARYTIWAPLYDRVARFRRARARSIALLALQPRERVLIVGCGTGADLEHIPSEVEIVAGDLTPAMVERAARRAAELGRAADVRILDAHALPFPDASFDAVVLHLIVAVVPDPEACVREAARVLRPGGRAAVFDKFVPDRGRPGIPRRIANLLASALFTSLTRRLGPLLQGTRLVQTHREPAALGGRFEIVLLEKR